jgi:hypothetical protein
MGQCHEVALRKLGHSEDVANGSWFPALPGQRARSERAWSRGTLGTPALGRTFLRSYPVLVVFIGLGVAGLMSPVGGAQVIGVVIILMGVAGIWMHIPIARLHLQERRRRKREGSTGGP